MLTGTELALGLGERDRGDDHGNERRPAVGLPAGHIMIVFVVHGSSISPGASGSSAGLPPAALPQVVV